MKKTIKPVGIFFPTTIRPAGCCWLLSALLLLLGANDMTAQRFVLGKPYALGMPRDLPDAELATLIRTGLREKSRDDAWVVYSDRHSNPTYGQPDGSGPVKRKIGFAEGPFYVAEERETFIRIAKCPSVDGLNVSKGSSCEDYGWVAKDKMLLWNGGLINRYTQIHQKVFLLNKGSELKAMIEQGTSRDLVAIQESPADGAPRRPDLRIYSFYFVLKRENGYFLLAKEARLGALSTSGADIVGWVRGNRCTDWNTRVSLEPNFAAAAFAERKANEALHVRGYERAEDARQAAAGQRPGNVFWDNDPVRVSANKLSRDARRFKGSVIRFPLLSSGQQPVTDVFRSCVIGEMPRVVEINGRRTVEGSVDPVEWAEIQAKAEEWVSQKDKVNILFAVQGTNKMNAYRRAIVDAMGQVAAQFEGKRVRYGLVVYRNVEDGAALINGKPQDKLLSILPLTADLAAAQRFLTEAEMNNWVNPEDYPALYYGLSQGISKAGFNARETNVVVVIGADANYAYNRALAAKYKDHRTMVKTEMLFDQLAANEIHLYAVQLINNGLRASELFRDQIHDLINETAKRIYYSSYGSGQAGGASTPPPDLKPLADSAEGDVWHRIEQYFVPGGIWYPADAKFVEVGELGAKVNLCLTESARQLQKLNESIGSYIMAGKAMQQRDEARFDNVPGPLAEAAALKFARDIGLDALYLQGDKYQLYSEVFFPRQLRTASHAPMSYVLFMPASDLTNYLNVIKRVRGEIGTSSSEKREGLVNIYRQLLTEFTGNRQLSERQFRETSVQEVALAIQGIEKEGVTLGFLPDKDMACLLNERCTPLSEIDKLLERFDTVRRTLEEEVFAVGYEFKYTGSEGNSYYWIPIEKTF